MPDFLPYRYVEKLGRVIFCRNCHEALVSGDPYVLVKESWGAQKIAVAHYPNCPRQTKTDQTIRMVRA
jgi:hypothetical protein